MLPGTGIQKSQQHRNYWNYRYIGMYSLDMSGSYVTQVLIYSTMRIIVEDDDFARENSSYHMAGVHVTVTVTAGASRADLD